MANSDRERKNKSENYSGNNFGAVNSMRYSRRGKPQQQIYRPGSGPLRKSYGPDEIRDADVNTNKDLNDKTVCASGCNTNSNNIKVNEFYSNAIEADKRRNKKPEQLLYVAKRVAKVNGNAEVNSKPNNSTYTDRSSRIPNNQSDASSKTVENGKKNLNRHHAHSLTTPSNSHNREVRQASEPRVCQMYDRSRDTRSVEPPQRSRNDENGVTKPPSGRRNSTVSTYSEAPNRDKIRPLPNLPPRLQKKFLLDNGYSLDSLSIDTLNLNYYQNNSPFNIYSCPNVVNKINFPGKNDRNQNFPVPWSQTLPLPRGRGRGIVRRVDGNGHNPHMDHSRVSTPANSRPSSRNDTHSNSQSHNWNRPISNPGLDSFNSNSSSFNPSICTNALPVVNMSKVINNAESIDNLNVEAMCVDVAKVPSFNQIKKLNWSEEVEMEDLENKMTYCQEVGKGQEKIGKSRRNRRSVSRNRRDACSRNRSSSRDNQYISEDRQLKNDSQKNNRVRRNSNSNSERLRHDSDRDQNWRKDPADSKPIQAPGLLVLTNTTDLPNGTNQRMLFDPKNPNIPIMVTPNSTIRNLDYVTQDTKQDANSNYFVDKYGISKPVWYDVLSPNFQSARNPQIVIDIEKLDCQLQWILKAGEVTLDWNKIQMIRHNLQHCLQILLTTDIKFCQSENVEHHFWKISFYNLIEMLRKAIATDSESKSVYQSTLLTVIDDGTKFYETLLISLEKTYNFNLEDYLGSNVMLPPKGIGFIGLALVASQKIFLFLGDLARYREQLFETGNYTKAKQYYMKAQQVNPKNGRPYNQLAILSIYARRKLDAVYYYMRSLMSSNPFNSARDCLLSLFDENRKKYEIADRKRRDEFESRRKARSAGKDNSRKSAGKPRETWVHPSDRLINGEIEKSSDSESEEDLTNMSSIELNKRFIISYLLVHGKLITKIGMESFRKVAREMLLQFRLLLQRSPLPVNSHRLLQLVALNMFAVDNAATHSSAEAGGVRTEVQERALGTALEMSSLLLERCITLVEAQVDSPRLFVPPDVQVILPAIKVWCDWLLCHIAVWNPPPPSKDLRIGSSTTDMWTRLAVLIGLLDRLNHKDTMLTSGPKEGHSIVRLQEDATLCGFTPLMYATPENVYAPDTVDPEAAQIALRLHKLQFFGTEFLCGVDPPVLKSIARGGGGFEYISVLPDASRSTTPIAALSEEQDTPTVAPNAARFDLLNAPPEEFVKDAETRRLLRRKEELERRQRQQQKHWQQTKDIIEGSVIQEVEVHPKLLVPDTNCFIDYLQDLLKLAKTYTLMVPIVVLTELEGLSRGYPRGREEVAQKSAKALSALRQQRKPGVKFVTSRGSVLSNAAFTAEESRDTGESDSIVNNDDRILATVLSLVRRDGAIANAEGSKRIRRDVVLLTMDRNLRVKAFAADIPARDLPDFVRWSTGKRDC